MKKLKNSHIECCICLEQNVNISLTCKHVFCLECINNRLSKNKSCPICRHKIIKKKSRIKSIIDDLILFLITKNIVYYSNL